MYLTYDGPRKDAKRFFFFFVCIFTAKRRVLFSSFFVFVFFLGVLFVLVFFFLFLRCWLGYTYEERGRGTVNGQGRATETKLINDLRRVLSKLLPNRTYGLVRKMRKRLHTAFARWLTRGGWVAEG